MKLWNNLVFLQVAAVVSALVLTFGAVLEYSHQLKHLILLIAKWVCRRSTPYDRCVFKKLLRHSIGSILVVLGIAGEFVFEGRAFIVEDRQEDQARKIVGSLQEQANAVSKEEDGLKKQLDAASKESDALQKRLDNASAQLGGLENDVLLQGPRWKLFDVGKNQFVEALKPFPRQKLSLVICGTLINPPPGDQYRLMMDMWESFSGRSGAGWNVEPVQWSSCPANGPFPFGGNMVLISAVANDPVKRAATALSDTLNKLTISTSKNEVTLGDVGPNSFIGRVFGTGSPWDLAAKDPTSIVLFIGRNPEHAWWFTPNNSRKR